MAIHTLEIMMKANTSQVMSGINLIEDSVLKIVEQVKSLGAELGSSLQVNVSAAQQLGAAMSSSAVASEDQLSTLAELDIVLGSASKRVGQITDRNAEFAALQRDALQNVISMADKYKDVEGVSEKIAKARAVINNMERNSIPWIKESRDNFLANRDLLAEIASSNGKNLKLNQDQAKIIKDMVPQIKNLKDYVEDIEEFTGLTNSEYEKLVDNVDEVTTNIESMKKDTVDVSKLIGDIRSNFSAIDKLGKDIGFGDVLSPLTFINKEMANLNSLYEQNHTVNSVFVQDMANSYNVTTGLSEVAIDAADGIALLGEAQEALTQVLQSGQAAAIKTSEQLSDLAQNSAEAARLTGVSADQYANMGARISGLTGDIQQAEKLTTVFVNVQNRGRLSADQMGRVVRLLNNDFISLNKNFATVNESGEEVRSGAQNITVAMSEMARLSAEAGGDASAAMDALGRAIQNPVSMAPLLQGAINSTDPTEMMLSMNKNAAQFVQSFGNNRIAMTQFAQQVGVSVDELESMAAAHRETEAELQALMDTGMSRAEAEAKWTADAQAAAADEKKAKEIAAKAEADATRQLQAAFSELRIIFAKVAAALQPVLEMLAAILSNPIAQWALIAAGAFMTLYVGVTKLVGGLKLVRGLFGSVGQAASKMGGQMGPQGGGLAASLKTFIETLSSIKIGKALKAAATIAIVGVSLAVGVAAIGLALNLMPPGRVAELLITIAGIVAASYVLTLMPPNAIVGALVLAVVGAALAVGIALIGLALNLMPPDRTAELLIVMSGLVAAALVAALLASIGPVALLGALTLAVVGAALAAGIALIGLALNLMPPGKTEELILVIGGLVVAALTAALLAAFGPMALMGALTLLAVGAALAGAVALLGLAMNLLPVNKAGELLKIVGILVGVAFASALLGIVAIPALVGALALVAIAGALMISVWILSKMEGPSKKAANAIKILSDAVSGISMRAGAALLALSAGLIGFALAMGGAGVIGWFVDFTDVAEELGESMMILVEPIEAIAGLGTEAGSNLKHTADGISAFADALDQGGFLGLFTPDFISTANQLGESMNILKEPIAELAAIGPAGGATFKSIGRGLTDMAEALEGGGMLDFFSGDKVENAMELARGMTLLTRPIAALGEHGQDAGRVLIALGHGLKYMAEAIDEGVDADDAEELAQSLWKLAAPIGHFMRVQANQQARASGNVMRQQVQLLAEELNAGLTVQIEGGVSERDDAIVEVLTEIRDAITEGGVGGGDGENTLEELRKMNNTLAGIMGEMMMGSSMGGSTVADSRYNT